MFAPIALPVSSASLRSQLHPVSFFVGNGSCSYKQLPSISGISVLSHKFYVLVLGWRKTSLNSKRKKQIYLYIRSCLKKYLGKTGAVFLSCLKVLTKKTMFPLVMKTMRVRKRILCDEQEEIKNHRDLKAAGSLRKPPRKQQR